MLVVNFQSAKRAAGNVIEFSCDDPVCGRDDQLGFLGQLSQIGIHECRGLLKNADSPYEFGRHSIFANVEMN
jgi:hypothetical protein